MSKLFKLAAILLLAPLAMAVNESSVYDFKGGSSDGSAPVGGLIADKAGNLYGTTGAGGSFGNCSPFGQTCGVVFELSPSNGGWTETILYTFTGLRDGGEPLAGLTMDSQGNLYGTTTVGGDFSQGTVFQLTPGANGWTETVLYHFRGGNDGAYPQAAVTLSNGNIYGTTYAGGGNNCIGAPFGCGTVYQLVKGTNGWSENVLYRFANGNDGAFPYASVIVDPAGNLYGATTQGGYLQGNCAPYGCGNVFQLKRSGSNWTLNSLHAFSYDSDGSAPFGAVLADSAGNLYGTASGGGAGFGGTAFELRRSGSTWTFHILHSFSGTDGSAPESSLVAVGHKFFGTTHGGGTGSGCFFGTACGTVFMLNQTQTGWQETVLHSFTNNGSDGTYPEDNLVFSNGALYGTTNAGGKSDEGTVFAVTR